MISRSTVSHHASQLAKRVSKLAGKTHKERVSEFNNHLESLSEHHDIPKVRCCTFQSMPTCSIRSPGRAWLSAILFGSFTYPSVLQSTLLLPLLQNERHNFGLSSSMRWKHVSTTLSSLQPADLDFPGL